MSKQEMLDKFEECRCQGKVAWLWYDNDVLCLTWEEKAAEKHTIWESR